MNTEEELEDLLSQPSPELVDMFKTLREMSCSGRGGKMGPTLARMAQRASEQSGTTRRVFRVSRFSDSDLQMNLLNQGIETISCDLQPGIAEPSALRAEHCLHGVSEIWFHRQ